MIIAALLGAVMALTTAYGPSTGNLNQEAQLDASQIEDLRQDRGPWGEPKDLKPCTTEDDQKDCFWDAQTQGNKKGEDFVVLDGYVIYVEITGKSTVTVGDVTFQLNRKA